VKERFDAAGIRPGAWGLPVDIRAGDAAFQDGLAALPRHAALARSLGTPWCSTWILPSPTSGTTPPIWSSTAPGLQPVARILADHGCRLGLEFIGPKTLRQGHAHDFITTSTACWSLRRRSAPACGALAGLLPLYTSHATVADIERLQAEQIVYVHLNDGVAGRAADEQLDPERELPGATGVIDLARFLQAVARTGFDGPAAVEPFNAALKALEPAERVRLVGESLARVLAQGGPARIARTWPFIPSGFSR